MIWVHTNLNSLMSQFLKFFKWTYLSLGGTPLHIAQRTCNGSPWETITTILSVYSSSIVFNTRVTRTTISDTVSHPETLCVGLIRSCSNRRDTASCHGRRWNSPNPLSRSKGSVRSGPLTLKWLWMNWAVSNVLLKSEVITTIFSVRSSVLPESVKMASSFSAAWRGRGKWDWQVV